MLAFGAVAPACVDLNEEAVSGITNTYYQTPIGFDAAVSATYEGLRDFYGAQRGFAVTVFGTDEYTRGADGAYKYINDYDASLNGGDQYFRENWQLHWRAINTANTVISRAPSVTPSGTLTEAVKAVRVGEARFLRALYYFNLVRMYGDIPIRLEETTDPSPPEGREPVAKVYEAIIADLLAAEAALPVTQAQFGRATKGAAQHFLALVYLTRGQPTDWALSAAKAKAAIASNQYALLPRWADLWTVGNENHKEVVFSVQYVADPLSGGAGNNGHLYFLAAYETLAGMTRTTEYGRAFKRFMPTKYLLGLFNRDIDSRYDDGFQRMWRANNASGLPRVNGVPKFLVGDTAIYLSPENVTPAQVAATRYHLYGANTYTEAIFPALVKFQDPTRPNITIELSQKDFMVARYAETLLIAAEALWRDGKGSEAVPYVNEVRRRAAKTAAQRPAMEITAAQLSQDFFLDERARELAGEMMRWFDLTRTKTLVSRVQAHNAQGKALVKDYHMLRPLPDQELQASPALKQNPGY